ncbi:MAG: hypothetical protein JXR47_04610 [Thiotrichales bacterium]|nr:hypothetical protein [Thiotrichales bacterium]
MKCSVSSRQNLTSACCRTGFPLRSKPAANAGVMQSMENTKMVEYYVTTKEVDPVVSGEQKKLILELPIDETIKNRFPFDDVERNKVEIFKRGSQSECQQYIDGMPSQISDLFTTKQFN